jgi:hypothetical protein
MKMMHLTFHFQFVEQIQRILDENEVENYSRIAMVEGKDSSGKHEGSQVYPGNITMIFAQVPDEGLRGVLDDLSEFREARESHRHLQAAVLGIEQTLTQEGPDGM